MLAAATADPSPAASRLGGVCGIVGQVRSDGRPVEPALMARMCAALEHRGPDSRGVHSDGGAAIGIQRLAVIDLETGDQPVFNEDRSVSVVLNGEIYNYRELRERLRSRGHRFATNGDAEPIAHLYEEHGTGLARELHGMFAFALWDSKRQRLLLCRDRVGKKPLLYCEREGALSFASELRALLHDPELPRELDPGALDSYLSYGYVPAPMAAFAAVRKLRPGSTLVWEQGRSSIERYWRLGYGQKLRDPDPREVHERLRELIRAAVRRRMIADVPLGVFLSGGIDSSVVVAAMAEASSEPVKTFSIGFREQAFSELPNARLVAERFGTDHHELVVRPDDVSLIPRIVRHYGEPFADTSSLPSFQVAEMTSREVTVALNGDGGDESFAGYRRYVAGARSERLARLLPGPVRAAIAAAGRRRRLRGDPLRTLNRATRLARLLGMAPADRYRLTMATFDDAGRDALYSDDFKSLIGASPAPAVIRDAWEAATGEGVVDHMLETDVNTYLPDDLLVKVDIATMAHSLEARSPLLDHELMEYAARIPAPMKLRGAEKKVVLREALRGWIPDQVLDGPKRGFALPMVGEWFRGELRPYLTETLTDPRALGRGYFEPREVRRLLDSHLSGEADNSQPLWALLMFEVWQQQFVDGGGAAALGPSA